MARVDTASVESRLREALSLHQQGDLLLAEILYREVLAREPRHAQALGLLGLLEGAKRNVDAAMALLRQSLALAPDNAANQFNLGLLLQDQGLDDEALTCFTRASLLRPAFAPARNGKGMVLKRLGRHQEALACYEEAIRISPDYVEAWNNHGVALRHLGRPLEALASFEKAIAGKPNLPELHLNVGLALHETGRHEEAASAFARSLELNPRSVEATMNRGVSLYELKRYEEANASLEQALTMDPGNADVLLNQGNVLIELNRHQEAIACFAQALRRRPDDADALMNMGNALRDLHRYEEALPFYDRALAASSASTEVRWNHALCLLAMGDFAAGWEAFEARRESASMTDLDRHFDAPPWTGEQPVEGKVIFVYAEQGLGDTIQFARFATELGRRGGHVILEVAKPLATLMSRIEGVCEVITRGETPPRTDLHVPMLSLPRALGTRLDSIPSAAGYLRADPALLERWRNETRGGTGLKLGLAWSGNAAYRNDHRRSVPLARLLDALPPDVTCWSLQRDLTTDDEALIRSSGQLHRFALNEFEHTAAQIMSLDAVIAVDTAVAHLAAALGKPTWLLLAFTADWRWMSARNDSPWYDSIRLFRQSLPGDWSAPLASLSGHIRAHSAHAQVK